MTAILVSSLIIAGFVAMGYCIRSVAKDAGAIIGQVRRKTDD